jgi:hypothetical protein
LDSRPKKLFEIPEMKNRWGNLSLNDKSEIKGLGLGLKKIKILNFKFKNKSFYIFGLIL